MSRSGSEALPGDWTSDPAPSPPPDRRRDQRGPTGRRPRVCRRPARVLAVTIASVALLVLSWGAVRVYQASRAGQSGAAALRRAERDLTRHNPRAARRDLEAAAGHFRTLQARVRSLGPFGAVIRRTPLVRIQVRGAERFAEAGLLLTDGGLRLTDAAATVLDPPDPGVPVSAVLEQLKATEDTLASGIASLDLAIARVRTLDGLRLVGPLASARRELVDRLPVTRARADSAARGLNAFIAFAGGSGPRRYLVFSQNPDEVRPTGGFIGTYGVLTADSGTIRLERYEGIEDWTLPRPGVVVAPEAAGSPFRFHPELGGQSLANANSVPDWPKAAALAADLWQRGGEEPVDGVLSLTPGFLARVLKVIGPVKVPGYGETVTAANLLGRIDFHVHETAAGKPPEQRKDFVAAVAEQVLRRLLEAPAAKRAPLAQAAGQAFDARELLAWSKHPEVQDDLVGRRWDGTLPPTIGDFFYDAEFEYAAKNGRALRRTYDHHVALRPDGSARVSTTLTIANTRPLDRTNPDSLSYITLYGPTGGVLVDSEDPPVASEPSLSGHPGVGWFRAAPPQGTARITVAWDAPDIARRHQDGTWYYGLAWMKLPDHSGDKVNLKIDLPPGWRWKNKPPPSTVILDKDLVGLWPLNVPKN